MGKRRTPHQQPDRESELVPFDPAGQTLDRPLLPYEKELIRILGCTEEEYRKTQSRSDIRAPSDRRHMSMIPDVRCEPISIIVNGPCKSWIGLR